MDNQIESLNQALLIVKIKIYLQTQARNTEAVELLRRVEHHLEMRMQPLLIQIVPSSLPKPQSFSFLAA